MNIIVQIHTASRERAARAARGEAEHTRPGRTRRVRVHTPGCPNQLGCVRWGVGIEMGLPSEKVDYRLVWATDL